tara:strand:+ start:6791 stop:7027 length:237 start_codon:yes stop_codon:yes gene_type:complete
MTKNELINVIQSLKTDLKFLKSDLKFRMEGNDIEGTIKKYENEWPAQAGTFQAMTSMDNDTFKRSIISIENMEKQLEI